MPHTHLTRPSEISSEKKYGEMPETSSPLHISPYYLMAIPSVFSLTYIIPLLKFILKKNWDTESEKHRERSATRLREGAY